MSHIFPRSNLRAPQVENRIKPVSRVWWVGMCNWIKSSNRKQANVFDRKTVTQIYRPSLHGNDGRGQSRLAVLDHRDTNRSNHVFELGTIHACGGSMATGPVFLLFCHKNRESELHQPLRAMERNNSMCFCAIWWLTDGWTDDCPMRWEGAAIKNLVTVFAFAYFVVNVDNDHHEAQTVSPVSFSRHGQRRMDDRGDRQTDIR